MKASSPTHFFLLVVFRAGEKKSIGAPDSVALLLFFVFWYAGNAKYNEVNSHQRAASWWEKFFVFSPTNVVVSNAKV